MLHLTPCIADSGNEHKKLFYERYHSEWSKKLKRTNLISEKTYKRIVKVLLNFNKMIGIKPTYMYRWKKHYHILSNQESNCLYRKVPGKGTDAFKRVPTYEKVFDIIHDAHTALGHAKCRRKNKNRIQASWYGVPIPAVLLYLSTCPICAGTKKISKKKKNPLKFIISEQVGTRSQVDLIDMRSFEVKGMKWILRYVNCLSGFSQVQCIPNKSSAVVGEAIIQILSASVRPLILQSDNGPEFLGK